MKLPLKFATEPSTLEIVIDEALHQLSGINVETEEYAKKLDSISKLYKLKEQEAPKRVSPDTKAIVIGNLAGIAMILSWERANVITSKALGFVLKSR